MSEWFSDDEVDSAIFAKIIVVGPPGVGKTSLIEYLRWGDFMGHTKPTIGADFYSKELHPFVDQPNVAVKLQIWDIAGQDRTTTISRCFSKQASGVLLVYDASKPKTAQALMAWLEAAKFSVMADNEADEDIDIPFLVAANKADLVNDNERERHLAHCTAIVQAKGLTNGYLVSAKSGENVKVLFLDLAARAARASQKQKKNETMRLDADEKSKGGCAC